LQIAASGVAIFSGRNGKKLLDDLSWEQLVKTVERANAPKKNA